MSVFLTLSFLFPAVSYGQSFRLSLEEDTIAALPGLQSFAFGAYQGKWLLLGGRADGLHRRQPFASMDAEGANAYVFVVDPVAKQVWSSPVYTLPLPVAEQCLATNINFYQKDSMLYLVGGYGHSSSANQYLTYPQLTAVNIPQAMRAIVQGNSAAGAFRMFRDTALAVTGGYLDYLDGDFYLVGGQNFIGRYNPRGPDFGPGFIQVYANEIRKFKIVDEGTKLGISDYQAIRDTAELHRRDYNMVPQIFPDGNHGFTAFSGVFQYQYDLPWLNTVDITKEGYTVNNAFHQLLNQYHSAHVALYDKARNQMHTVFLGGIGRYTVDSASQLTDDLDVPFVQTISKVTRFADGSMQESKLPIEMPALLGASAAFIAMPGIPQYPDHILNLDEMGNEQIQIGYLVGGIESTAPNIFFTNTGVESVASAKVFKVFLQKTATEEPGVIDIPAKNDFALSVYPSTGWDRIELDFTLTKPEHVSISLLETDGGGKRFEYKSDLPKGAHHQSIDISKTPSGAYLLRIDYGDKSYTEKLVFTH